jgi:hypothetical protein
VNENAFVSIVQTRPCPTFGRPLHRGFPHRLRPGTSPHALPIPSCDRPLDGHPALRGTASSGSSSALAVSSFRFRARLDVCIPSTFLGQRGITPAFGYGAPHSSARGTLTLPNNVLLSTHYGVVRLLSHPFVSPPVDPWSARTSRPMPEAFLLVWEEMGSSREFLGSPFENMPRARDSGDPSTTSR